MATELYFRPLLGGALIGLAVSLMLLFNGRVTGISGILGASLRARVTDRAWRVLFVLGLVSGGAIVQIFCRDSGWVVDPFFDSTGISLGRTALAGVVVGFGTLLGSGCTSGHGVCGLSRLSSRSIAATLMFMMAGIATVALVRRVL